MSALGKVCSRLYASTASRSHARALLRAAQTGGPGAGGARAAAWHGARHFVASPSAMHASAREPEREAMLADRATSSSTASTSASPQQGANATLTLPTILTLGRVAAIPVLIAVWYWQSPYSAAASTAVFAAASLTDWLDGYLARKMNLHSAFGAFLDPVADKLMVAAVLVLLCTRPLAAGPAWLAGNDWLVPVCTLAIIGREITMSALREWAASLGPEARAAVAVSAWGKWKTASQMASLTLLLLVKDGGQGAAAEAAAAGGAALLLVASWLTVHSLALYIRGLWRFFAAPPPPPAPPAPPV